MTTKVEAALMVWLLNQLLRLSSWCHRLGDWISKPVEPKTIAGKMLQFVPEGRNLGRPVYHVISIRGTMFMGTVQWSNQWGRARFNPDSDATFDQTCIAEIYACMRDMK